MCDVLIQAFCSGLFAPFDKVIMYYSYLVANPRRPILGSSPLILLVAARRFRNLFPHACSRKCSVGISECLVRRLLMHLLVHRYHQRPPDPTPPEALVECLRPWQRLKNHQVLNHPTWKLTNKFSCALRCQDAM
jgi:hypothetical protein